jgi:hypothetical protein
MRNIDFRSPRAGAIVLSLWAGAYAVILLVLHVVGGHRHLPDESLGVNDAAGGLAPALRQLLGRPDPRDFYVDYASAHAMLHGQNAYANSNILFKGLGPAWDVRTANPHPPTLLPLVAPFALANYGEALAAWALLMTFLYVATVRLLGVRLSYSIAIGVGIAVTFPGAFGIGNPVPIVGFGVALAYRFRYHSALAGLGIALAAMPKGSGLVLAIPFLAAARIKTLLWAAGFYLAAAVLPILWQSDIWAQYFRHGTKAISANAVRRDNANSAHRLDVFAADAVAPTDLRAAHVPPTHDPAGDTDRRRDHRQPTVRALAHRGLPGRRLRRGGDLRARAARRANDVVRILDGPVVAYVP